MEQATPERIRILYEVEHKSLREIGALINRDHHWVKRRLVAQGVEIVKYNKPLKRPECEVCGSPFIAGRAAQRFCSHRCRGEAKRLGLFSSSFTRPRDERTCPTCGESFICRDTSKQKYCSHECYSLAHSVRMAGENNPAYTTGSSFNKRCFRGSHWEQWRQAAYNRDNFTCQACGEGCVSRKDMTEDTAHLLIQCHHITPYKSPDDNRLDNLVTLCARCHAAAHNGT